MVATLSAAAVTAARTSGLHAEQETLPREQLRQLQLQRLQQTLRNAWDHVPWHRRRLHAAGLDDPRDVDSLEALRRLPFTVKTDLRDNYPFGLFTRPTQELARLHASSGTTGKPTVVGYIVQDLSTWADLVARSFYCAGVRPGDLVHNAYGYGLFTGGLGAHDGATRLGCPVVPISGGGTERQVALIMDFQPRVLCATPSYALALAEVAERQGVNLRDSALRIGMFGAEPWSDAMRREIEARVGLRAVDIYGLSEIMGPGVACECELRCGLHGWEDHFLFETIDPDTGQAVPEGEPGELVITTLTKQALPMLRYRTRDITRLETAPAVTGRRLQPRDVARDRPQRRHDDRPRRERLSVADRVGAGGPARAVAALPAGARPPRRTRQRAPGDRSPARGVHGRLPAAGAGGGTPHQVTDRHQRRRAGAGARQCAALTGEGRSGARSAAQGGLRG